MRGEVESDREIRVGSAPAAVLFQQCRHSRGERQRLPSPRDLSTFVLYVHGRLHLSQRDCVPCAQAARQPIRGDEVPAAGQPLPHTHPGLLAPDEIAPGLTAVELASRREALAASLGEGDCCLLTSAAPTYMAGIIPYPYRPDPDFFYLTGITQVTQGTSHILPHPNAARRSLRTHATLALSLPGGLRRGTSVPGPPG